MRLLREPLLHFLLLGGVLFLAFSLLGAGDAEANDRIVVSPGRVEHLATMFARTWQRPPTPAELQGLVEDWVREEVYYREALAMGLDRDDTVIRRRLRQKLEFLAEDLADLAEPTEAECQAFLDGHADSFRIDGNTTFVQVYLSPDRRGDALARDARRLLDELNRAGIEVDPTAHGDPFLLPHGFAAATDGEVRRAFGESFATALIGLEPGRWHGPIESSYGAHLVLVQDRTAGRRPPLGEVRDAVRREWSAAARRAANDAFFRGLRARYEVVVEDQEEADR